MFLSGGLLLSFSDKEGAVVGQGSPVAACLSSAAGVSAHSDGQGQVQMLHFCGTC
jgi:hypothetical protein